MLDVGLIFGVWDLLHVGHVNILASAAEQCDILVVGVPTDDVVLADKKLPPIIPHSERYQMLLAVQYVDKVLLYDKLDFLPILETVRPHILFIGEQWGTAQRHREALNWASQTEASVIKLPYYHYQSTTKIKQRVIELCGQPL